MRLGRVENLRGSASAQGHPASDANRGNFLTSRLENTTHKVSSCGCVLSHRLQVFFMSDSAHLCDEPLQSTADSRGTTMFSVLKKKKTIY